MSKTPLAFLVAPLVASVVYSWFGIVEHSARVGVPLSSPLGFFFLSCLFAYTGSVLGGLPIYFMLRRVGMATTAPLLVCGTLLGWLFISFLDDGKPWLHPEAFAVGLLAACIFVIIRAAP